MSLIKSLMGQGVKPSGFQGTFIGKMMNRNHTKYYRWGIERASPARGVFALDIGCGGGEAARLLAGVLSEGKVFAIDHSPEMVELASQTNRDTIREGRVEIRQASVSDLPYADDFFSLAIAIETIQFWSDLKACLREVRRVLKPEGQFLIVNNSPDLEGKDRAYKEILQIHSSRAYEDLLIEAGFQRIIIDTESRPGMILIIAQKSKAG